MDFALHLLQIVAPVFALAAIGYVWVRVGLAYDLEFVSRLSMQLGLPCLLFTALARAEIQPALLADLAVAGVAGYLAVGLLSLGFCRLAGLDLRAFLAPMVFGNTGNLGLPLALFAYGQTGLTYALIIFAVMASMNYTLGVWFVSARGSQEMLRMPITYAVVLGGGVMLTGWTPPVWAMNTLDLLGQIPIPLMLITLGVAIAGLTTRAIGLALLISLVKLAIGISVGVAVVSLAGLGFGVAGGTVILQLAMPVAVTSYMLAARYHTKPEEVAGLVVASTLLAVPAIPLTLAFLLPQSG